MQCGFPLSNINQKIFLLEHLNHKNKKFYFFDNKSLIILVVLNKIIIYNFNYKT